MKIEKGAKANRFFAILLISVLLVAQFITASFAEKKDEKSKNHLTSKGLQSIVIERL